MELMKAYEKDIAKITDFYRYVINNKDNMNTYAKWIFGKHPTEEMICGYIKEGTMYYGEKDGSIAFAAAVMPYQGADYHDTKWDVQAADDEVSVVHILCVDPNRQKQGIARAAMESIISLSRAENKKAVRLDALACNTPAHRLYNSLGFIQKDIKNWYADNVGQTDFFLFEYVL